MRAAPLSLNLRMCGTYVWVSIGIVGEKLILSFQPISYELVINKFSGTPLLSPWYRDSEKWFRMFVLIDLISAD